MNEIPQKYSIVKRTPLVTIVLHREVHEAIKVYAYSKNLKLRVAAESLIRAGLQAEYEKKQ